MDNDNNDDDHCGDMPTVPLLNKVSTNVCIKSRGRGDDVTFDHL